MQRNILGALFGDEFREDLPLIEQRLISPPLKNGRFSPKDVGLSTQDSLVIGISHNTQDGGHHYYLMSKSGRYDAAPYFGKSRMLHRLAQTDASLANGAIFEIEVSPATMDKIYENSVVAAGGRHVTCIHGICKVLQRSGIKIEGVSNSLTGISSQKIVQSLMTGKLTENGKKITIDKMRVYANSMAELEHVFKVPAEVDRLVKKQLIKKAKPYLVSVAIIVPPAGYFLYKNVQEAKNCESRGYEYSEDSGSCLPKDNKYAPDSDGI